MQNFDGDALLAELGVAMGMDQLVFDSSGTCVLKLDEIVVSLQRQPAAICLSAFVANLPGASKSSFLEQLLAANLFWNTTQGCTLALEPDTRSLLLHHRFDACTGLPEAQARLSTLVDAAESLRKLVWASVPAVGNLSPDRGFRRDL